MVVRRVVSTPFVLVVAFPSLFLASVRSASTLQELLASHFFSDGVVAWRLSLLYSLLPILRFSRISLLFILPFA